MPGKGLKEQFRKDFKERRLISESTIKASAKENSVALRGVYLFMWKALHSWANVDFEDNEENKKRIKAVSSGKYSSGEDKKDVQLILRNLMKADYLGIRHIDLPEEFYSDICTGELSDEEAKDMGARWALYPQILALKGLKGEEKINETAKVIFLWKYLTGKSISKSDEKNHQKTGVFEEPRTVAIMEYVQKFQFPSPEQGESIRVPATKDPDEALPESLKQYVNSELASIKKRTADIMNIVKPEDVLNPVFYPIASSPDFVLSPEELRSMNTVKSAETEDENTDDIDSDGPDDKENQTEVENHGNEIKLSTDIKPQKHDVPNTTLEDLKKHNEKVNELISDEMSELKTVSPMPKEVKQTSLEKAILIYNYGQHTFKEAIAYATGKKDINELSEMLKSNPPVKENYEIFEGLRDAIKNYKIPQIDYNDMTAVARVHTEMELMHSFAVQIKQEASGMIPKGAVRQDESDDIKMQREIYALSVQLENITGSYVRAYVMTLKDLTQEEVRSKAFFNRLYFTEIANRYFKGKTIGEVEQEDKIDRNITKESDRLFSRIINDKFTGKEITSYLSGKNPGPAKKYAAKADDSQKSIRQEKEPEIKIENEIKGGSEIKDGNEIKNEIKNRINIREEIINEDEIKDEIKKGDRKASDNKIIMPKEEDLFSMKEDFALAPQSFGYGLFKPAPLYEESSFGRILFYAVTVEGMDLDQAADTVMDLPNQKEFWEKYSAWDKANTSEQPDILMHLSPAKRLDAVEKINKALNSYNFFKPDYSDFDQVQKEVHKNLILIDLYDYLTSESAKVASDLPLQKVKEKKGFEKEAIANQKTYDINVKNVNALRGLISFTNAFLNAHVVSGNVNGPESIQYPLYAAYRARFNHLLRKTFKGKNNEQIGKLGDDVLYDSSEEEKMVPYISEKDAKTYLKSDDPKFEKLTYKGIKKFSGKDLNLIVIEDEKDENTEGMWEIADFKVSDGMIDIPQDFINSRVKILEYGMRHEKLSLQKLMMLVNGSERNEAFSLRMKNSRNEAQMGDTAEPLIPDQGLKAYLSDQWDKLRKFNLDNLQINNQEDVEHIGRSMVVLNKYASDMIQMMESVKKEALDFNRAGFSTRKLYDDVIGAYKKIKNLSDSFIKGYCVLKESGKYNMDGSVIADEDAIKAAVHRVMFERKAGLLSKGYTLENILENGKEFNLLDKQEKILSENPKYFDSYDARNMLEREDTSFGAGVNDVIKNLGVIGPDEEFVNEGGGERVGISDDSYNEEPNYNEIRIENLKPEQERKPEQEFEPKQQPKPGQKRYDFIKSMGFTVPKGVGREDAEEEPDFEAENPADEEPMEELMEEDLALMDEEYNPVREEENRILAIEKGVKEIENFAFPDINWGSPKAIAKHADSLAELVNKVDELNALVKKHNESTTCIIPDGTGRINRCRAILEKATEFTNGYKEAYFATGEMAAHMVENPGIADRAFMQEVAKKRAIFAVKAKERFSGKELKNIPAPDASVKLAEMAVRTEKTPHLDESDPKNYLEGKEAGFENWVKLQYEEECNLAREQREETAGRIAELPRDDFRAYVFTESNLVAKDSLKNDLLSVFTTKTTGEILHKRIWGGAEPVFEGENEEQIRERLDRAARIRNKVNTAFDKLFTPAEKEALLKAGKTETDAVLLNGVPASDIYNYALKKYNFLNDRPHEKEMMIKIEVINEFMRGKNEITKEHYATDENGVFKVIGSTCLVKGTKTLIKEKKFFDKLAEIHRCFAADIEFWNNVNPGNDEDKIQKLETIKGKLPAMVNLINPANLNGKTFGQIVKFMQEYDTAVRTYTLAGAPNELIQKRESVSAMTQEFIELGNEIGLRIPGVGGKESFKNEFDRIEGDYRADASLKGFQNFDGRHFADYYFPDGKFYPELVASFNRDLGINHIGLVTVKKIAEFGRKLLETGNNATILEKVQNDNRISSVQGLFCAWLIGHKGLSIEDAARLQNEPVAIGNKMVTMDDLHKEYITFCSLHPVRGEMAPDVLKKNIADWFEVYKNAIGKMKEFRIPDVDWGDIEKRAAHTENMVFLSNLAVEVVQELEQGVLRDSNKHSADYAVEAAGGFEEYNKLVNEMEEIQNYLGAYQKLEYLNRDISEYRNMENIPNGEPGKFVSRAAVPALYIVPVLNKYRGMTVSQMLEEQKLDSVYNSELFPLCTQVLRTDRYNGDVLDDAVFNPDMSIAHMLGTDTVLKDTLAEDKRTKEDYYKNTNVPTLIKEAGVEFFEHLADEAVATFPTQQERNARKRDGYFYNRLAEIPDDNAAAMREFLRTPVINGDTGEEWLMRGINDTYNYPLRKALEISGTKYSDLFIVDGQRPEEKWGAKYDALIPAPTAAEKEKLLLLEVAKAYRTGSRIESRSWTIQANPHVLAEGERTLVTPGLPALSVMKNGFDKYEVGRDHIYNELLKIKERLAATQTNKEANFVRGKGVEGTTLYKDMTRNLKECLEAIEKHRADGKIQISEISRKLNRFNESLNTYYTTRHKFLIGAFSPTGRKRLGVVNSAAETMRHLCSIHEQLSAPFNSDVYSVYGKQTKFRDCDYDDIRRMTNRHKGTMHFADGPAREDVEDVYVKTEFQDAVVRLQNEPVPSAPKGATAANMQKAWTYLKSYYQDKLTGEDSNATLDDLNNIGEVKKKAGELAKDRIFLGAYGKEGYVMLDYWPRVEKKAAELKNQFKNELQIVKRSFGGEEAYIANIQPNPGEAKAETVRRAMEQIHTAVFNAGREERLARQQPGYQPNPDVMKARKDCYARMADILVRQMLLEDDELGKRMGNAIASDQNYYREFHSKVTDSLLRSKFLEDEKAPAAMRKIKDESLEKEFSKKYLAFLRGEGQRIRNQASIDQNYIQNLVNHRPDVEAPANNANQQQPNGPVGLILPHA